MNSKRRPFQLAVLALILLCAANAFAAAPTISGFSPASGALNSTVTITGTNFTAPVTVSFNGVNSSSVTVVSSTSVKATVPATASTGAITLSASGGSATSTSAFTVLPGLVTSTTVGPPTTALTVYYSGFSAREAVDLYFDTEDFALSTTSAAGVGNIAVTVPADAHPGAHWISAVGRHSGSAVQIPFTVRASWPQFGFVPSHKAKNHYENILSAANALDLDQAWQSPSLFVDIESTPAIVNGIVYAGFSDDTFRAFDETTGAQKWTYTTGGNAGYSSPAVANGIVYAGSSDYYLYALDAVTGALKWRYQTGGAVYSSPNVVNGIVYFGSYDDNVYAVNATTGALVWRFATGNFVYSSPAVANGVLYVGSFDGNLYALNAATGAKLWAFDIGFLIDGSPALAGGLICVGSMNGTMYGLYPTGAQAWSYATSDIIDTSPAVVGGAIFFGTENGTVYSLSSGGAFRWSTSLNANGLDSPLCVANGVVYVTMPSNTYALDENTGAVLTTMPLGSDYGGPAVVNGAVFVPDSFNGLIARYTPNGLQSNFVAPRPDPRQLRPRLLR